MDRAAKLIGLKSDTSKPAPAAKPKAEPKVAVARPAAPSPLRPHRMARLVRTARSARSRHRPNSRRGPRRPSRLNSRRRLPATAPSPARRPWCPRATSTIAGRRSGRHIRQANIENGRACPAIFICRRCRPDPSGALKMPAYSAIDVCAMRARIRQAQANIENGRACPAIFRLRRCRPDPLTRTGRGSACTSCRSRRGRPRCGRPCPRSSGRSDCDRPPRAA